MPRETNVLPPYSCTVAAEAKVMLNLELINPMHVVSESEWREVYLVLRGTLLSFHRVKSGRDGGSSAGKLIGSYTLQHAEVGLAADAENIVLYPRKSLANLIPQSARKRAWHKDPELFTPIRQTILRLRAETDQILLGGNDETEMHQLLQAFGTMLWKF